MCHAFINIKVYEIGMQSIKLMQPDDTVLVQK